MNNSAIVEQQRYTCALGALQSVVAIPRAVPILHAGPGCGEMITGFFERSAGYAGGSTMPCTNFSEKEVVFGGINRLRQIIRHTYQVLDTDLQVVMTGCTAAIVGDDVDSLVAEFVAEGKPIVAVATAGFNATNFEAHSLVVKAILQQYVGRFEAENEPRSSKNMVNLLASIPYQDPFWKGNLAEYKRLLAGLGLKANVLFGPEAGGVQEWQSIPKANFNILVSPWYGKPVADYLKEKYGQDYTWFRHPPIGANATEAFLRQVLAFALQQGAELDEEKAYAFIQHESAAYYEELENLAAFLLEFRYGLPNHVHILHDAGYVLGLAKFLLHEVGIVPQEQFITDGSPAEFQEAIRADLQSTSEKKKIPLFFEPDAGKAQAMLRGIRHQGRGLIIGAGWDRELAREKGYDFLPAAVPATYRLILTTNYVGFSGGLRVIEDIYQTILATYA